MPTLAYKPNQSRAGPELARHFGLDGMDSPNYIAFHGADSGAIFEHLERIYATAVEIILVQKGMILIIRMLSKNRICQRIKSVCYFYT